MDLSALKGVRVQHITLGQGIITDVEEKNTGKYISVFFADKDKTVPFAYPDAFAKYLKSDEHIDDISYDIAAKEEKQRQEQERLKKITEENSKKASLTGKAKPQVVKETIGSNIAFKCTFCDGGSDETHIGFRGICSNEIRDYNLTVAKTAWCSHPSCSCTRYAKGEISFQELLETYEETTFTCYESRMLKDWKAYAGTDLSGDVAFKRRNISKLHVDNIAILTTREPGSSEQDRIIFAVFIVAGGYFGDEQSEGYVKAHEKYRLSFSAEEAKRLKFWNYYRNKSNPDKAQWGTGLYRYLDNQQAVTLLEDVVKLKEGTNDESLAKEFLDYFKEKNKIIISQ